MVPKAFILKEFISPQKGTKDHESVSNLKGKQSRQSHHKTLHIGVPSCQCQACVTPLTTVVQLIYNNINEKNINPNFFFILRNREGASKLMWMPRHTEKHTHAYSRTQMLPELN